MRYKILIDAASLHDCLSAEDWRIFDCRFSLADPAAGYRQYLAGHVPGARHADLERVLAAPPTAETGRHPLPDRTRLAEWLGREGVGADTQIVAYDDAGGAFAARLWWLARWLGHEAVSVLDGGLAAWQEVGGLLESGEAPAPVPAHFPIRDSLEGILDVAEVLAIVRGEAAGTLVDARAAPRYCGESEPVDPVAGHIPGARNAPFAGNLDGQGRFLAAETLRERFGEVAADPQNIVHYCGSGVTACHNALAMTHAGLTGSRLYPGSWSEWIRAPGRPIERGSAARK